MQAPEECGDYGFARFKIRRPCQPKWHGVSKRSTHVFYSMNLKFPLKPRLRSLADLKEAVKDPSGLIVFTTFYDETDDCRPSVKQFMGLMYREAVKHKQLRVAFVKCPSDVCTQLAVTSFIEFTFYRNGESQGKLTDSLEASDLLDKVKGITKGDDDESVWKGIFSCSILVWSNKFCTFVIFWKKLGNLQTNNKFSASLCLYYYTISFIIIMILQNVHNIIPFSLSLCCHNNLLRKDLNYREGSQVPARGLPCLLDFLFISAASSQGSRKIFVHILPPTHRVFVAYTINLYLQNVNLFFYFHPRRPYLPKSCFCVVFVCVRILRAAKLNYPHSCHRKYRLVQLLVLPRAPIKEYIVEL